MRYASIFLLMLLAACGGPELNLPQGLDEGTLEATVKNGNPLWNPSVARVDSVRVLSGSQTAPDRYEFEAEYQLERIAPPSDVALNQLKEREQMSKNRGEAEQAARIAAAIQKIEASEQRITDLEVGKSKKLTDRFVMVRTPNGWTLEAWAKALAAPPLPED